MKTVQGYKVSVAEVQEEISSHHSLYDVITNSVMSIKSCLLYLFILNMHVIKTWCYSAKVFLNLSEWLNCLTWIELDLHVYNVD